MTVQQDMRAEFEKYCASSVFIFLLDLASDGETYSYQKTRVAFDVWQHRQQEIDRLRAECEWRPIETAPMDGRLALIYRPLARNSSDEPVVIKRLIGGNGHCWSTTVPEGETPTNPTDGSCHVTHWMPLPPPPKVQSDEL